MDQELAVTYLLIPKKNYANCLRVSKLLYNKKGAVFGPHYRYFAF